MKIVISVKGKTYQELESMAKEYAVKMENSAGKLRNSYAAVVAFINDYMINRPFYNIEVKE